MRTRGRLYVRLAGFVATAAVCSCARTNQSSNHLRADRAIVFVSRSAPAEGSLQLFTIRPDGSNRLQLTHQDSFSYNMPVWSTDGLRIAAVRTGVPRANGTDLVVLDAADRNERVITHLNGAAYFPDWSPDGRRLVVAVVTGSAWAVTVVTLDDGSVETILPADTAITYIGPAWTRDGTALLVSENAKGHTRVLRIDLAGGERRVLLATDTMWLAGPAPSPDGRTILLTGSTQSPLTPAQANPRHLEQDLYLLNADGSGLRRLTFGPHMSNTGQWSPDGQQIVFVSDRHTAGNSLTTFLNGTDLYVMRRDGTSIRRLTTNTLPDIHPRW